MVWVYTGRIVAMVANKKPLWDGSDKLLVRDSMRKDILPIQSEPSIPASLTRSPNPAPAWHLAHVTPKTRTHIYRCNIQE